MLRTAMRQPWDWPRYAMQHESTSAVEVLASLSPRRMLLLPARSGCSLVLWLSIAPPPGPCLVSYRCYTVASQLHRQPLLLGADYHSLQRPICNCRGTSYSSRDDTVGAVLLWARTCPPFRPAALSARCFSCTALRSALVRAGAAAAGRAGRAAFAAPASVHSTDTASMLRDRKHI